MEARNSTEAICPDPALIGVGNVLNCTRKETGSEQYCLGVRKGDRSSRRWDQWVGTCFSDSSKAVSGTTVCMRRQTKSAARARSSASADLKV